jgi:hypothetical protein
MDDWENGEEMDRDSDDDDDDDADDVNDLGESDESDDDSEEENSNDDEIAENFIRTFHTGDFDAEFDDALNSDRALMPPALSTARTTQASYNKPDNWRERNRIGLERVKEQLQNCICVGYDNSFNLELTHNSIGENEEPIVWHEPVLDEYWDELEEEIVRIKWQDSTITDIVVEIENVELKKEHIATLFDICHSANVVKLINVNLCSEGIIWLSKLVDVMLTCPCFTLTTIGLIAWNRLVAFLGH